LIAEAAAVTRELPVAILLWAGVGLIGVAVAGLLVMRSALDRLHYTGPAAFGTLYIGLAILIEESFSLIGDKALAVGVFVVLSGLVLVHVTARAIRIHELGDWRIQQDEDVEVEEL
jgi:multisubunit Na+/H+ antiporter MnhG subunit